jgi:hypothetical protein
MTEVCFCGWSGELADKDVVILDESKGARCCPRCGHVDDLDWLGPAARNALLQTAHERRILREMARGVAA